MGLVNGVSTVWMTTRVLEHELVICSNYNEQPTQIIYLLFDLKVNRQNNLRQLSSRVWADH